MEIITVWVDDLLLFATNDDLMKKMKEEIQSEWEVTDLGEPAKIIGIEIKRNNNSITITQEKYIDTILKHIGKLHCTDGHRAHAFYRIYIYIYIIFFHDMWVK